MAKSKITGKTFDEMLSESTELDLSAKFKDIIYEFSNDVHAMGIVVYTYEEENAKFLFKDPDFTKPITDYELLAMYLDEVVATRLVDEDTSLERCRDLENEKVQYYEYKDGNFIKRFYKIGEYYSGETYKDLNGFVPGGMPLVGTAVVGVDKVAENEPVPMMTIWEGTFTPETIMDSETGSERYIYYADDDDIQNVLKIMDLQSVDATFDGLSYALEVHKNVSSDGYGKCSIGDSTFGGTCPFFVYVEKTTDAETAADIIIFWIETQTGGEHTIKVEGAPSNNEDAPTGDPIEDIGALA